ncbi:ABC transporter permease subunit [Aliiglaciecola sp. 2_MG-2023]|uniref:ABC transporter permease subunit n=1 Tax=unclassified Aliiglaciecola TaxID=2593648 RepID=UPI0026E1455C|nr:MULTISPECIES: ABC transporter permease subunit [unclassified Aliiglaciecola]MDO6711509.1 ABC transporter permease subunit [Aliiglaciecola sp. 2_MG-2023]MDO6752515.1 ABC transporter permease subunit [Aliiglaciecola sp. 1_MG-2023]
MGQSSIDESSSSNTQTVKVARLRKVKNRLVAAAIATSGWLVLLTLGLLLWQLVIQVLPLARDVSISPKYQFAITPNESILYLGDVINSVPLVTMDKDCRVNFYSQSASKSNSSLVKSKIIPALCTDQVKVKAYDGQLYLAILSHSGILRIEKLNQVDKHLFPELEMTLAVTDVEPVIKTDKFDFQLSANTIMLSVQQGQMWKVYSIDRRSKNEIDVVEVNNPEHLLLLPRIGQFVYVADSKLTTHDITSGRLNHIAFDQAISTLNVFPSQRSLFIGLQDKTLQKWSIVNAQGQLVFQPMYSMVTEYQPKNILIHQSENAAFITDQKNQLKIINYVTGEQVSDSFTEHISNQILLSQNLLYTVTNNTLNVFDVNSISAVNSIQSLWGKNSYEGYPQADYVWQTTSAADYHETKFSLVPLVIGSLKASFLALLIAVPLAVCAAIYTGFFAPERLRNWIKPSIEVLEAIPSVVLGFIAAIWLAPLAEQFILSLLLFVLLLPLVLFLFALLHHPLVQRLPQRFKQGWELPLASILLIGLGIFVYSITDVMSLASANLHGHWLLPIDTLENINKNTLVVALALGIAIVPSIYSLAEDAIYEVPNTLKQASSALGATRLQTLRKVVLILAYPGILSAIALGLGRAFGETMIVLMVTGNTPVADWNLLSGLRTLTANLAIEMPEAEVGSSHYQILFLTGLVLFLFTFVLNTFAELLRQWLRKNYQHG